MTVLLDTGPLVSYLDPDDRRHDRAKALLEPVFSGQHGLVLSSDCVFDEGMTLIRVRKKSEALARSFHTFFWGPWEDIPRPLQVIGTTLEDHRRAGDFQLKHFDQGVSLTDATLIGHARQWEALVATFDQRFAGLVGTVPEPAGPS